MRQAIALALLLALIAVAVSAGPTASAVAASTGLDWEPVLAAGPARVWRSPWYETDAALYATTGRDLRRTTDAGETWQILYPTPPATQTVGVDAFALDPSPPASQTLFVARNPEGGAAEIHRSADDGLSWTRVFTTSAGPLRDLAAAPDSPSSVFAVGGPAGVWRSVDGGESWQAAAGGVPEGYTPSRVYASPAFTTDQTLYLTGFGPLQRSVDGCDSWHEVEIPWVDIAREVVFSPQYASDGTLWVSYFWLEGSGLPELPPNGVVRSTDFGATWQPVNDGLPVDYLDGWILGLAAAPQASATRTADTVLYAVERAALPDGTAWGLYRSPHGGDGWIEQGGAPDETPTGLLAAEPGLLFLSSAEGLWRLRTTCWEWLVNGGAERDEAWEMPVAGATASYSTAQAHGGSRSIRVGIVDGENKYAYSSARQQVTLPADAESITLSTWLYPVSTGTQMAAYSRRVLEAGIAGEHPSAPTAGDAQYVLLLGEEGNIVERLLWMRQDTAAWEHHSFDLGAYAGQTVSVLFGAYNDGQGGITGMYVDDVSLLVCKERPTTRLFLPLMHKNWQRPEVPAGPLLIDGQWAYGLVGHPRSTTIYGLAPGGLYRSDDGAEIWTLMNASPPVTQSLLLAPGQPGVLYGGKGYPCYAGGPDVPLWKSEDGGQTWSELPAGLNLQPLAVHPTDAGRVYARGCPHPWVTDDGGATWTEQADELFLTWFAHRAAPAAADDWQTVYFGGVSEGGGGAILGSTDCGADWQRLTPPEAAPWWISALALDPISSTHVYFGEPHAFWGSHDGGTTWFTSTKGLEDVIYDPIAPPTHTYGLLSLAYVPDELDRWLLGTVRGLYATDDRGLSWSKLAGPAWQDDEVEALLLRWAEPDKLFVTTPQGVYVYYLP